MLIHHYLEGRSVSSISASRSFMLRYISVREDILSRIKEQINPILKARFEVDSDKNVNTIKQHKCSSI